MGEHMDPQTGGWVKGPPYTVGVIEPLTVGLVFWPHKTPGLTTSGFCYLILSPLGMRSPSLPRRAVCPCCVWQLHSSRTSDGGDQVEDGTDEGPSTQTCLGYNP